jgi:hypothetical protein
MWRKHQIFENLLKYANGRGIVSSTVLMRPIPPKIEPLRYIQAQKKYRVGLRKRILKRTFYTFCGGMAAYTIFQENDSRAVSKSGLHYLLALSNAIQQPYFKLLFLEWIDFALQYEHFQGISNFFLQVQGLNPSYLK